MDETYTRPGGRVLYREYSLAGETHRDDGPAEEEFYPSGTLREEVWMKKGRLHRDDGPAIVAYDETGDVLLCEFWKEGEKIRPSAHQRLVFEGRRDALRLAALDKRRSRPLCRKG